MVSCRDKKRWGLTVSGVGILPARLPERFRVSRVLPHLRLALVTAACWALPGLAHAQNVELPAIDVDTKRETGTGPVVGYVAKQSVTATKTDTPILETPQSISVIPKDQIADQQTHTITEALRYTPGISLDTASATTFYDSVYIRGFLAPQYLDGLRLPIDPGTSFAVPRIEPYGLERLEVLKGPSSGLYGAAAPGGLLNMVSKRPTATPHAEIEGQYGSFDRFQGGFDVGGALDKDGQFLARIVGLGRDANTQIDFLQDNKVFIAPSFTWRPNADTSFTILTQYQDVKNKGFQQYVPGQGSLLFNPFGRISRNTYIGEPGDSEGYHAKQAMAGYAFEHRFNEVFQFRQNFRYTDASNNLAGVRDEGINPDIRTTNRSINYVVSDSRNIAVDNQLQADFNTGPLRHTVLAGLDYLDIKSSSDYRFAFISPIDVFNPVYGAPVPTAASLAPFIRTNDTQKQTGVYLQDQIKLDRWTLSLSGRHDWAETKQISTGLFPAPGVYNADDQKFTGRAGLTYLFDFGLAPYINYSTSFVPVLGATAAGAAFRPTTGAGKEIGVKYQPTGMNLLLTAALFDITQQNVLTADPNNNLFNIQTGEARSRGVEFEARGNVTREFEIIGGYSRFNPKVTSSNNGDVGNYLPYVAIEQASLWGKYTWYDGPVAGLGLGAGVRYVGKSYGDAANTITITPYTLYDAAISYDFAYRSPSLKGLTAQLNATNLFDKYYVSNCFSGLPYCGLGQGRTVLLTLKYAWK
jgi:iron complex outermembrane receptor protein